MGFLLYCETFGWGCTRDARGQLDGMVRVPYPMGWRMKLWLGLVILLGMLNPSGAMDQADDSWDICPASPGHHEGGVVVYSERKCAAGVRGGRVACSVWYGNRPLGDREKGLVPKTQQDSRNPNSGHEYRALAFRIGRAQLSPNPP